MSQPGQLTQRYLTRFLKLTPAACLTAVSTLGWATSCARKGHGNLLTMRASVHADQCAWVHKGAYGECEGVKPLRLLV